MRLSLFLSFISLKRYYEKKKKKIVKSGKFWKKIYKEKNDHKGVVVHGRGMLHTMN